MKETHGITHSSETRMALWMSPDPTREATPRLTGYPYPPLRR